MFGLIRFVFCAGKDFSQTKCADISTSAAHDFYISDQAVEYIPLISIELLPQPNPKTIAKLSLRMSLFHWSIQPCSFRILSLIFYYLFFFLVFLYALFGFCSFSLSPCRVAPFFYGPYFWTLRTKLRFSNIFNKFISD